MNSDPIKNKSGNIVLTFNWLRLTKDGRADQFVGDDLDIPDLKGISVSGKDLVAAAYSADHYATEEKVSRTEVLKKLQTCYNIPFTVCFDKKDGSERVMRCRLIGPDEGMGRSMVTDLDAPENDSGKRIREVDHRTLKYLIVGNVKYTVKK